MCARVCVCLLLVQASAAADRIKASPDATNSISKLPTNETAVLFWFCHMGPSSLRGLARELTRDAQPSLHCLAVQLQILPSLHLFWSDHHPILPFSHMPSFIALFPRASVAHHLHGLANFQVHANNSINSIAPITYQGLILRPKPIYMLSSSPGITSQRDIQMPCPLSKSIDSKSPFAPFLSFPNLHINHL